MKLTLNWGLVYSESRESIFSPGYFIWIVCKIPRPLWQCHTKMLDFLGLQIFGNSLFSYEKCSDLCLSCPRTISVNAIFPLKSKN